MTKKFNLIFHFRHINFNDSFTRPTTKHIKLETSLNLIENEYEETFYKQHVSSASSTTSSKHNESFLSSKSSLKTSSTTSSLVNNFNKQVKFLLDSPSTRSISNDTSNRLLLTSPVTTTTTQDSSGSSSNFNETPIQFSRTSSLQSLNSDCLKSPIPSSVHSEYSLSRHESGAQSPFYNEQVSFLTNDSNPRSNEITVIEKTMIQTSDKNENNTILYEIEDSPWECHSPNSDCSSLSLIREDNKLLTPINADLDAIYKLLSNKKHQQILFTPPVKLEKRLVESPLSPACSELSIPSVIQEDLKSSSLNFIDLSLLNSRFMPSVEVCLSKPLNTPVRLSNENLNDSDESAEDDNKILLDFVNKMLPSVTKKEAAAAIVVASPPSSDDVRKKCPIRRINVPIVNMTKTAQLRMSRIQKSKLDDENNAKFKVPAAPKKNLLKRKI